MIFQKELLVFVAAISPIIEVRGSVPLGIILGLSPYSVLMLSIIASIIPVIPILWFLNTLTKYLRRILFFDRFFEWLFVRTRARSKIIEDLEVVGLIIFIGIPLPGTGVWTGCVAAYLLGLSWIETFIAAAVGTSISSIVVMFATLGILRFF